MCVRVCDSLDPATSRADERIKVQTDVLRHLHSTTDTTTCVNTHSSRQRRFVGLANVRSSSNTRLSDHLVAVKAAPVGRLRALEVAQRLDQALVVALLTGQRLGRGRGRRRHDWTRGG